MFYFKEIWGSASVQNGTRRKESQWTCCGLLHNVQKGPKFSFKVIDMIWGHVDGGGEDSRNETFPLNFLEAMAYEFIPLLYHW